MSRLDPEEPRQLHVDLTPCTARLAPGPSTGVAAPVPPTVADETILPNLIAGWAFSGAESRAGGAGRPGQRRAWPCSGPLLPRSLEAVGISDPCHSFHGGPPKGLAGASTISVEVRADKTFPSQQDTDTRPIRISECRREP